MSTPLHRQEDAARNRSTIPSFPTKPRYDQPALANASTIYASSLSHEPTTLDNYSSNDQSEGQAHKNSQGRDFDDAGSVFSYNSTRDVNNYVKELHGRIFNNLNEAYLLPSDQDEWARLDKQGSCLAIGFDGLYPCPEVVEAILLPVEGQTKRVLDIGCGTGAWAMQMALKFPHVSVLGVDLAPTPMDQATFPPNLSIEIDDITLGLSHFAGKIDLVHMRCVSGGLTDIDKTMVDLQMTLRPGGLVIVVDGDVFMMKEDRKTIVPFIRLPSDGGPEITGVSENGSWLRRLIWEACHACEIAGACLTRTEEVNDLGLWDSPLCDPETARSGGVDFPIGPWAKGRNNAETQLLQYVGILMRQNLRSIQRAYHAIMLKQGMDQATLDEWSDHVDEELDTGIPRTWLRFRFMMARRRAGQGLPAPPLPSLPSTLSRNSPPKINEDLQDGQRQPKIPVRYPAFDVYYTREENMARMRQRRSTFGVLPPSVVRKKWESIQASRWL